MVEKLLQRSKKNKGKRKVVALRPLRAIADGMHVFDTMLRIAILS